MALVYLPELEHLDLSQNPLSAAVCAKLGPAISAHIALHELVLSHCKLSDTAASHIISAISDQGEIKILDLQVTGRSSRLQLMSAEHVHSTCPQHVPAARVWSAPL